MIDRSYGGILRRRIIDATSRGYLHWIPESYDPCSFYALYNNYRIKITASMNTPFWMLTIQHTRHHTHENQTLIWVDHDWWEGSELQQIFKMARSSAFDKFSTPLEELTVLLERSELEKMVGF